MKYFTKQSLKSCRLKSSDRHVVAVAVAVALAVAVLQPPQPLRVSVRSFIGPSHQVSQACPAYALCVLPIYNL